MPKFIHPAEVAELVTSLLTDPGSQGELDTQDSYRSFLEDIGKVIADHCGGVIDGSSYPSPGFIGDMTLPLLQVSPNSSLPSITECVWAKFDESGWAEESAINEYSDGHPMCPHCGCPVEMPFGAEDGEAWTGRCTEGHIRTFKLSVVQGEEA